MKYRHRTRRELNVTWAIAQALGWDLIYNGNGYYIAKPPNYFPDENAYVNNSKLGMRNWALINEIPDYMVDLSKLITDLMAQDFDIRFSMPTPLYSCTLEYHGSKVTRRGDTLNGALWKALLALGKSINYAWND